MGEGDNSPEVRSPGGAALGLGGGRGTLTRTPLRPLPAPSAGDGPGLRRPSEGCAAAAAVSSRRAGLGGEGCDPGRGPGAAPAAAPAFQPRAPGGDALRRLYFFWGGAAGDRWERGPVCVPLRAGALPPPRRRPEPHKRTGCC